MLFVAVLSTAATNRVCSYGIKQGLPDNTVNCIAQDNRGFIWTGTSNGLAQFDGMFFTLFRYSNNDTTSISNNNVHSLLATDHGMYIATDYCVDFYSYKDSKFRRCQIKARHKVGNSFISLVSTSKGVFVFDDTGRLYRSSNDKTLFEGIATSAPVLAIASSGDRLFVVTSRSVAMYTADGSKVLSSVNIHTNTSTSYNASYSHNMRRLYVGRGVGGAAQAFAVTHNHLQVVDESVPIALKAACDYNGGVAFATDGYGVVLRRSGAADQ